MQIAQIQGVQSATCAAAKLANEREQPTSGEGGEPTKATPDSQEVRCACGACIENLHAELVDVGSRSPPSCGRQRNSYLHSTTSAGPHRTMRNFDICHHECQTWLAQFGAETAEYKIAHGLLANILLVTASEFEGWLERQLNPRESPVRLAAFAIRGGDAEPLFRDRESNPLRVVGSVGSEGRIANSIKRHHNARHVFDHPSLNTMARAKVRTILLLDDQLGSGKRAIDFCSKFLEHPTINSWISGNLVNIIVSVYASLPSGRDRWSRFIRNLSRTQRKHVSLVTEFTAPDILGDDPELRRARSSLLQKFTSELPRAERQWTYGHKRSLGSIVFEHGCPNNVPAIFWSYRPKGWKGLFKDRLIPRSLIDDGIVELAGRNPDGPSKSSLIAAGPQDLESVLALLAKGIRSVQRISSYLRIGVSRVEQSLAWCIKFGLITDHLRITGEGRRLLESSEETHVAWVALISAGEVYLPRGARGHRED